MNKFGKLNERQVKFCEYYVKNLNASLSAKLAGYSEKSARTIGPELLKKGNIKQRIKNLQGFRRIDVRDHITFNDILLYHLKVATANLGDYMEFGSNHNGQSHVKLKNSNKVDLTALESVTEGKDGIKIKLVDKKQSLEFLNKYLDQFKLNHANFKNIENIEDIKDYLNNLLKNSAETSNQGISNQIAITSKILDCLKSNNDQKLEEIERILKEITEDEKS
jgi:phage terminase small subunit